MKVVHLVTGNLESGAGQGALWLHLELLNKGCDSHLLTSRNPLQDFPNSRVALNQNVLKIISQIDILYSKIFLRNKNLIFSTGKFGLPPRFVPKADIYHIHSIKTGFLSIRGLLKLRSPIVWTFRDMWPFTGGCHYDWNCNRFTGSCGKCPILSSQKPRDLSSQILQKKAKVYSKVSEFYPIAISPWLQQEANRSSLFPKKNVGMIWNGIDLQNFDPIESVLARKELGLPIDKKILLIGASHSDSKLKGYDSLLTEFNNILSCESEFIIVRFGRAKPFPGTRYLIKDFGYILNRRKLNLLYAAADIYLNPSPQEAFGKTIVESLASGTPVVVFGNSGPKDMVIEGITGHIVQKNDPESFAREVLEFVKTNKTREGMKFDCVKSASTFSAKGAAEKYIKLYKDILEK